MAAEAQLQSDINEEVIARADADNSIETVLEEKVKFWGSYANGEDILDIDPAAVSDGDTAIWTNDEEAANNISLHFSYGGDWYRASDGAFGEDLWS